MGQVTEKNFYKQLSGDYAGALVCVGVGLIIVAFCAVFCGTQLGWTNLLTIILLIALAGCLGLLIMFIVKFARVKSHPTFKRYGSAASLAARINAGLQNPRYFTKATAPGAAFGTLMTSDFIVSGLELINFLELKDAVSISRVNFPEAHRIVIGNPILTAASVAANYAADKYVESQRAAGNMQHDMAMIKDTNGKSHSFGIRSVDLEAFLKLLHEIAPHIKIEA